MHKERASQGFPEHVRRKMSKQEAASLLARTEKLAAKGEFELFKTSAHFDYTAYHPEWLGGQSPLVVDTLAGPPGSLGPDSGLEFARQFP